MLLTIQAISLRAAQYMAAHPPVACYVAWHGVRHSPEGSTYWVHLYV